MIRLDRLDSAKLRRARELVRGLGSVLVAYSGGVDSTLLLKLALEELGAGVAAALASSPAYLEPVRERLGLNWLAYGATADDAADHRPGHGSAVRRGVRFPLLEAGMDKSEIRAAARAAGLPNWNKPAFACLSSRVPHGTPVTERVLRQVEAAEAFVKSLGVGQVRVRHHGDVARVEVEASELQHLLDRREAVVHGLRSAGYKFVALDLEGYTTGSLNRSWRPVSA
jgi:uncharacterized protein